MLSGSIYANKSEAMIKYNPGRLTWISILQETLRNNQNILWGIYSISKEICTRFFLCCALLWLYIDFPISIRLTSLALWQSNDCPSASKATLMNMDKYFMWIHYERLHKHSKAKHNKTVCIFLGIYFIVMRSRLGSNLVIATRYTLCNQDNPIYSYVGGHWFIP